MSMVDTATSLVLGIAATSVVVGTTEESFAARPQNRGLTTEGERVAAGCMGPRKMASESESGMAFCAYITRAMATHSRMMMVLMKGHRNGDGL